ncbi:hypothetical protein P3S68_006173 [Capsicum galapagoense]
MQAAKINEKAMPAVVKMLNAEKIVASEILKYGYQPKIGLGPRADGIVEPIQLKQQKGTTGLGYDPIFRAACEESKMAFQKLTIRDAEPGKALQN